jgi:ParB-like chromosome segregation protein Spo0J
MNLSRSNLYNFPPSSLESDPLLRRTPPNQEKLDEMKASILEQVRAGVPNGILQPGVVWNREDPDGTVHSVLLIGQTRKMALEELGKEAKEDFLFPCRIIKAPNIVTALRMALDENEIRSGLTGMDVSNYLWMLVDGEGFHKPIREGEEYLPPDIPRLAAFFRKSEAWVSTHLKLKRNLAPEIQTQVEDGSLPTSVAMKLTDMSPEEQKEILEKAQALTGGATRDSVVRAKREAKAPPAGEDKEEREPTARTAKQISDYLSEVVATEDPSVMPAGEDWRLSTLVLAHAKLILAFVQGKITDEQMDRRVQKMFKDLLEDAGVAALKRWKNKQV